MNIMAQIFAIIALIFMFFSYQKKSKKDFLFLQIFMNIFFGIQYFLLNAFSALVSNIISIVKSAIFYKYETENTKIPFSIFCIFEFIILISGILTYNGLFSIIPIIIALMYTYGTLQNKLTNTYKTGVLAAVLWIIYNYLVGAYASIIGSIIELISSIVGLIRLTNNKDKNFLMKK